MLRNTSQEDEEVGVDPTHSGFHTSLRTVDWDLNVIGEEKEYFKWLTFFKKPTS